MRANQNRLRASAAILLLSFIGAAYYLVTLTEERSVPPERAEADTSADHWQVQTRESAALMPEELRGLSLGMSLADARRLYPSLRLQEPTQGPDGSLRQVYAKRLSSGAQVIMSFSPSHRRLIRVQVLSMLAGLDAIAPHLEAMNGRYGSPAGVWDCPDTGGTPTRRFIWSEGSMALADIFLVYGDRVSVTMDILLEVELIHSLRTSSCHQLQDPSQLRRFPQASPGRLQKSMPR